MRGANALLGMEGERKGIGERRERIKIWIG
jgi:hypothetical protein